MTWSAHVFPHGPITELFPSLFVVQGSLGRSPLPRNMVVARLPSGGLWIHSAIALDDGGMHQLEGLGSPEILIVPSALHRADAGVYKDRYPALRVLCPRATIDAVSTVVNVDGACEFGTVLRIVSNAFSICCSFSTLTCASRALSSRSSLIVSSTFPLAKALLIAALIFGSDVFNTSGIFSVMSRKRLLTDLHSNDSFHSPRVVV